MEQDPSPRSKSHLRLVKSSPPAPAPGAAEAGPGPRVTRERRPVPPERQVRLRLLKAQIDAGEYNPSVDEVAAAMLARGCRMRPPAQPD